MEKTISLWIDLPKINRDVKFKVEDFSMGLLMAYLLKKNGKARLKMIAIMKDRKYARGEKVSV